MADGIRVLDRAFDIIDLLAVSHNSLSFSEIVKQTGLSKSTTHRLLTAMHGRHYIEKRADGSYSIGIKMLQTASYHINALELLTESNPHLSSIRGDLNLTAHLGILEGYEVVYISLNDTHPNSRLYAQVGKRSPAYCSSIGKCLLACLGRDELEEILYNCAYVRHTERTITDPDSLRGHLVEVRGRGWAMDNEEFQRGHRCLGAPVFDYRGEALAAISVSGYTSQMSDERLEGIRKRVCRTAAEISRSMGYTG